MHYPVIVVTAERPTDQTICGFLAPYDERLGVEPYVKESYEEVKEYLRSMCTPGEYPDCAILEALEEDDIESLRYYNREESIYYDLNSRGEALSVSNPRGKWDFWGYSGRWSSRFLNDRGEGQLREFLPVPTENPFALLLPSGEWLEPSQSAWWLGSRAGYEEKFDWAERFNEILRGFPGDYWVTLIDCHI